MAVVILFETLVETELDPSDKDIMDPFLISYETEKKKLGDWTTGLP